MNTKKIMDESGKQVKDWIASFNDAAIHNHAFLVTPNIGSLYEIAGKEVEQELTKIQDKAAQLPEEVVIKEVSRRWSVRLGEKIVELQAFIGASK